MRSLRLVPTVMLGLALTAPGSRAAAQTCATTPTGRVSWFSFGGSSVDLVRAKLSTDQGGVGAAAGQVGDGYLFDGVDDRVLVGNAPELALTGSLSVEAWVRVDVANSDGIVLFRGETSGGLQPYSLGLQNGALVFHLDDGTSTADFVSPAPLTVGSLTHVAATLDNATGDVHLYENGSEVASGNTSVRPIASIGSGGVAIGNTVDGGAGTAFEGLIDELSTYSTPLTPTQVQAIYAAGSAGTCGIGAGRVGFTTSSTRVDEADGTAQLVVFRTGGQTGAAAVGYQTTDGTATQPADYLSASGTLNWGPNDVSLKVVSVSIVNDTTYETNDESFTVDLSGVSGASFGPKKRITVYIDGPNDNPGTIQFGTGFNGYENLCSQTITVTRTGGSAGAASVDYATTAGTATPGAYPDDYSDVSGTLNWADGDNAPKTFDVPLSCDGENPGIAEDTETVLLSLSNVTGAFAGARQTATLTIYDSPGRIEFNASSVNAAINEGPPGFITLTVDRVGGRGTSVSVDYATVSGGTPPNATAGSDYTPVSGQLVWGYGEGASKTITIPVTLDSLLEAPETFQVQLSNVASYPTNGATLGTSIATVTISDNVKGRVAFTSALFVTSEGGGSVLVSVNRTQPAGPAVNLPATVTFTLEDIAAQFGADYGSISNPPSGTLSWTNGELGIKTIEIPILQDLINEGAEDFRVRIATTTDLLGSPASTRVQINDDDPAGAVSFTVASQSVVEGATATLLVRRTGGSAGAFDVAFSVNPGTPPGAGKADATDYGTPTPATTISFADGDTADKTITLPITALDGAEPLETFTVRLNTITMTSGVVSATFGTQRTQTIRIAANTN